MKRSALLLGLVLFPASVFAALIDSSTGGAAVATVNAGGTGDYLTLGAAVAAVNAAGTINRPWTIQIETDTTEATNIYMGANFGVDGSITIKPAPSTAPVVTFTDTTTPPGIFGHFVIGVNSSALPDLTNYFTSSNKYVLDGSNTVGGTTRDLTFQAGTSTTPFASPVNRIIRIFGANDGVVVKNMKIYFYDTAGNNHAIGVAAGQVPSGGANAIPLNTQIINNELVSGGTAAGGVGVDTSGAANGTVPAGSAITGLVVRDNDITARQRGVFLSATSGATVERNRITLTGGASGTITYAGIFHFQSNGVTPFSITIDRNVIDVTVTAAAWTAAQGPIGIFSDTGSAGAVGAFQITNNTVKVSAQGTEADILSRGMSLGSVTSNYVVEHNSVEIADGAASGASASRLTGISSPSTMTTGSVTVRNNIVVNRDASGSSSAQYTGAVTNVTSVDNVLVGRVPGRIGATDYATVGDWNTTSTIGTNNQSVDPATTTPAWGSNLQFASAPGTIAVVANSTTLTDVNGNARPATGAFPGAQQPSSTAADWMQY